MNELLFSVIEMLVVVFISVGIKYVVPLIKAELADSQYKWACEIVSHAVKCAEQVIKERGGGEEKKKLVIKLVSEELTAHKLNITENQLNALIESAVFAINKAKKEE